MCAKTLALTETSNYIIIIYLCTRISLNEVQSYDTGLLGRDTVVGQAAISRRFEENSAFIFRVSNTLGMI